MDLLESLMIWGREAVWGMLEWLGLFSPPPRPNETSSINKMWLQTQLRQRGVIPQHVMVTNVLVDNKANSAGMVGMMKDVRVTYAFVPKCPESLKQRDVTNLDDLPHQFLLKLSKPDKMSRKRVQYGQQTRECKMYNDHNKSLVGDHVVQAVLPTVIYAYESLILGEYVILSVNCIVEDGGTLARNIFEKARWGLHKDSSYEITPLQLMSLMFSEASKIHARYWNNKSLLEASTDSMKTSSWYNGKERAKWETSIESARSAWKKGKEKYSKGSGSEFILSPELIKIIDNSFAATSWDDLQEHLNNPAVPFTLVHGDFHAANIIYIPPPSTKAAMTTTATTTSNQNKEIDSNPTPSPSSPLTPPKEGKLVIVDWSEVGPWEPTLDLAQTIISDFPSAMFEESTKPLLREAYWANLTDEHAEFFVSKEDYPFEQCWEEFCRAGTEKWLWIFAFMVGLDLPPFFMNYLQNQILTFIDVHTPSQHTFSMRSVVIF
eukprot:m.14145 g.14145  ORF g.14145 m.14145 type:complete len:491 (+) comp7698_c0_seq1:81-1553(+)